MFESILSALKVREVVGAIGVSAALFVIASVLVVAMEAVSRRDLRFVASRAFVNDVVYSVFYYGGLNDALIWTFIANASHSYLGFMQTGLLTDLPMWQSVPIFWIGTDFIFYWMHRAMHRYQWLWPFHAVHHAERELNSLSQMRRHPVEHSLFRFVGFFPIAFVLGLPTQSWIPLAMAIRMLQALHHAQLNWRFGPFYRILVSPVFHSVHHSSHPDEIDTNYGTIFSCWDYMFGTAASRTTPPAAYGLVDEVLPERLSHQFIYPFARLAGRGREQPQGAAPEEAVPAEDDFKHAEDV